MRETAQNKLERMTRIERPLWALGLRVAGIDEAGRGPLAGPVAAGCALLAPDKLVPGVDDSKKLSPARRELLYAQIVENAEYARVGWATTEEIEALNILGATRLAMQRAAAGAVGAYFLVDSVTGLSLPGESESHDKGDQLSHMVAAASILAKVERDRLMLELDKQYPQYGFARNKGYGTPEHIEALEKYGPCPAHRRAFITRWCP